MNEEQDQAARVQQAAGVLADALRHASGLPSGLSTVRLAVDLRQVADEALASAVRRARASGHTWQELGDTLNTTRQAAFQRFGRPAGATAIDPATGLAMTEVLLPGAAERALAVFAALFDGRDEEVAADFDETMRAQLPLPKLGEVRAQLDGLIGRFERAGEPFARVVGTYTVVDVPLAFEAGEMNGRVSYDRDGRISGLFVLLPQAV
ncbi:MAG TPA: DUF3887 domain-containing protein [Actinocrinis sp.]|nr:DUF3887 domain-containing protein [Actinocrinis sp.]